MHSTDAVEIVATAPSDPRVRHLLEALDDELAQRYPEEVAGSAAVTDAETGPGRGTFVVAMVGGEPVGCAALRTIGPGLGEVKRVFVRADHRGRRVVGHLLAALDDEARRLDLARLVLETGVRQPEAIAAFARAGFTPIDCFGPYVDSPLSLCMGKDV